jgi:UV DNA damage endonuclease
LLDFLGENRDKILCDIPVLTVQGLSDTPKTLYDLQIRSWSVDELLPICEATATPLVVDWFHHQLNGSKPFNLLPWQRIWATWHGQRPKLHYSEQDPTKRAGAHSQYVNAQNFQNFCAQVPFTDYDVMLECKAKELALLRLREELVAFDR